jgi:hypothetical protein
VARAPWSGIVPILPVLKRYKCPIPPLSRDFTIRAVFAAGLLGKPANRAKNEIFLFPPSPVMV